jgi:hypothetical protein
MKDSEEEVPKSVILNKEYYKFKYCYILNIDAIIGVFNFEELEGLILFDITLYIFKQSVRN